jgi:hypothetical protein
MAENLAAARDAINQRNIELNRLRLLLLEHGWEDAELPEVPADAVATEVLNVYKQSSGTFARMQALSQRVPDLKANAAFSRQREDLKRSEGEVRKRVNAYDSSVRAYNAVREGIPTVFYARLIGHPEVERIDPEIHEAGALLTEQFRERTIAAPPARYFYMSPGGVPKGPASLDELKALLDRGSIQGSTLIAEVGSDEWLPMEAVSTRL